MKVCVFFLRNFWRRKAGDPNVQIYAQDCRIPSEFCSASFRFFWYPLGIDLPRNWRCLRMGFWHAFVVVGSRWVKKHHYEWFMVLVQFKDPTIWPVCLVSTAKKTNVKAVNTHRGYTGYIHDLIPKMWMTYLDPQLTPMTYFDLIPNSPQQGRHCA